MHTSMGLKVEVDKVMMMIHTHSNQCQDTSPTLMIGAMTISSIIQILSSCGFGQSTWMRPVPWLWQLCCPREPGDCEGTLYGVTGFMSEEPRDGEDTLYGVTGYSHIATNSFSFISPLRVSTSLHIGLMWVRTTWGMLVRRPLPITLLGQKPAAFMSCTWSAVAFEPLDVCRLLHASR